MSILSATNLWKTFPGSPPVDILKGVSLELQEGETLAIMGSSGEGKSTLLHILGSLEPATKGKIDLAGSKQMGFIFQAYHLLDDFTTLENVCMPLLIARSSRQEATQVGKALLKEVGLEGKEKTLAKFLSGGEKQRVAIARALANNPSLLLADEPTGNLDRKHSEEVEDLLLKSAKIRKKGLIVVTHDEEFARKCDRTLLLKGGHLYTDAV